MFFCLPVVSAATLLRVPGVVLSISVGAAHVPDHATTADALYARADEALYAAKRAGRDRTGQVAAGDRAAAA